MKTLYYFTKSKKQFKKAAAKILDGKNDVIIWCHGIAYKCTGTGAIMEESSMPQHRDAVEIFATMTEKETTNAHRIASGRAGVREAEEAAENILAAGVDNLTKEQRLDLLALVNVAYHDSGKIEGCFSVDSCASCAFCQKMIAAAMDNVLIICGACYAAADAYKEFSWRRHSLNARILSSVLFTAEELKVLHIDGGRCRFNEDGDTVNETHARNLLRIAETRQETMFGYWFKNAVAVEAGLHAEGYHTRESLPQNIRFIHSALLIGFPPAALWFDDAIFVVYPDAATTAAAIAAGAHACNGKRCRACKYWCYTHKRQEKPVIIAELLRCGKETRARILAAYEARKAALAS